MSGSKLYLGSVAQVIDSTMTIIAGKQLNVIDAPTSEKGVANRAYVDLKAKQVQDALDLVIAGSDVNFDTLLEIKNLSDNIRDTGATNLSNSITAEATARSEADATELAARVAAVSAEEAARIAAVSAEEAARIAAVSAEEAARIAAVSAEEAARIAAVSAEAATRTAEDAKLNMLAIKSSKIMSYVPAVYADSTILPKPLELCSYLPTSNAGNFDGWRMRNDVAGKKFNFYVPSNGLKVGDVKAMYLELCAPSVVSMPFITIYTNKQNDGNDFSWYRSRATYTRNATDTLVAGSNYNMVSNLKNVDTFNSNYLIRHDTVLDTTSVGSKNLANMLDTDDIMFFSIGSDSGSSVGNVECIISKFRLQLETGICEFVFSNTHVFVDYMKQKQIELWRSFFGTSATDNPFISNYQIPLPDYSVR